MDPTNFRLPAGSPSSSEAVASTQNTPETKLTALSPEELRSGHQAGNVAKANVPPTFALNVFPASNGNAGNTGRPSDPFVGPSNVIGTGTRSSRLTHLSAAATAFKPTGRHHVTLPGGAFKHRDDTTDSRATTPRATATRNNTAATASTSTTNVNPLLAVRALVFPKFGAFSTDHDTSRYLMIGQVALRTQLSELEGIFNVSSASSHS